MIFLRQFRHFILDCLREFKSRKDLQILFAVALVLRLGYFVLMLVQLTPEQIMTLSPDTIRYVGLGKELLNWRIMDEAAVLIFGPGYGTFLGADFFLFGINPVGILLVQILLSGLSCLLIYRLGRELTGSKAVAYLAGLIAAFSFTSISLANAILSDTLFFFLFLWGNLAFLLALKNRKWSYFIFSGLCIGLSILTRSIGQFWPLVMIGLVFILPFNKVQGWQIKSRLSLLKKAWIAPLIAVVLMGVWMARNYHHHSVMMLTFSSAGGPANVAALALSEIEDVSPDEIKNGWIKEYGIKNGGQEPDLIELYKIQNAVARRTFAEYPRQMINTYLDLTWQNLNEVNSLYRFQLPAQDNIFLDEIYWLRGAGLQYLNFWFCMGGFLLMLAIRKWRAFMALAAIYLYFAMLIGFTQYQGSRLFFPGQIAWSIVIAFLIVMSARGLIKAGDFIKDRWHSLSLSREISPRLSRTQVAVILIVIISGFYIWHALQYGSYIVDDAGISYTYSRNLADGYGLVFNPGGEKVEGYTNPLWVFLLAVFIKLGLFHPVVTPKVISIIATIASFAVVFRLFLKLRPTGFSVYAAFLSVLAISANSSLTVWSVSGLENGLYNFLIIYAVYRFVFELRGEFGWPISGLLFFLVALTRPDGIMYVGAALVCAFILASGRKGRKALLTNAAIFIVLFGAYHIWHYHYFTEYLSNTYFAKRRYEPFSEMLFDPRWYGWQYVLRGLTEHKLYWILPIGVMALFSRFRKIAILMAVMAVVSLALPIIGHGDWMMQYRLLHPTFMLIIVMAGMGLLALADYKALNLRNGLIPALILLGVVAIIGSARASVGKRLTITKSLTTKFESVRKVYHEFNTALADTLMIPRPTVLAADIGATGYYGGLTIYDVGNLADYHFARYQFGDYFGEYVFDELKPHFLTYQGAAVARYTRMQEYPELGRDYLTYHEIRPDPNDTGVYSGHYIRKDIVVKQNLPWMAGSVDLVTAQGSRLNGYVIPPAISPKSQRLAVALYWQSPSEAKNDKFRIMLTNETDHVLTDTLLSVGYDWYKPGQWLDTGSVCQYLFIPIPDSLEEGDYILSFIDATGDRYDLKRIGFHRQTVESSTPMQYGYEDFIELEAERSRKFGGNLHRITESGIYMKMLRADYWESEEGQELIGNYVLDNFAEITNLADSSLVDSHLGILAEIRSLNPTQKDVIDFGNRLNRYYAGRAKELIAGGWRHYSEAFDCLLKAIKASAGFPEVRKELEAIRPWASYLKNHPELLTEYDENIPVVKWLDIYREFLRGSKFKYRPFHKLFVNRLVDTDQVENEWGSSTVLDRMHLRQMGLASGSYEDCYDDGGPLSTFGNGKLVLADCRIKHLAGRQYLFEAVFIPRGLPNRKYALSLNIFAPSVEQLPETYRQRGNQPYSFSTIPPLWELPGGEPSYVWRVLELDYNPVKYNVTVYVPGGPPWYPLDNDNPGDNFIPCADSRIAPAPPEPTP